MRLEQMEHEVSKLQRRAMRRVARAMQPPAKDEALTSDGHGSDGSAGCDGSPERARNGASSAPARTGLLLAPMAMARERIDRKNKSAREKQKATEEKATVAIRRFAQLELARCYNSWVEMAQKRAWNMSRLRMVLPRLQRRDLARGWHGWQVRGQRLFPLLDPPRRLLRLTHLCFPHRHNHLFFHSSPSSPASCSPTPASPILSSLHVAASPTTWSRRPVLTPSRPWLCRHHTTSAAGCSASSTMLRAASHCASFCAAGTAGRSGRRPSPRRSGSESAIGRCSSSCATPSRAAPSTAGSARGSARAPSRGWGRSPSSVELLAGAPEAGAESKPASLPSLKKAPKPAHACTFQSFPSVRVVAGLFRHWLVASCNPWQCT